MARAPRPSLQRPLCRSRVYGPWPRLVVAARSRAVALAIGALWTVGGCDRSLSGGGASGARVVDDRPNVLIMSVDTLRPDHLHCYGYERETSPNIDRLAGEGALFENVISSTSWTLPAHAALFTGLADSVHGAIDTTFKLSDTRVTLAERLRDAGYQTAGFFSGPYLHPVFGLGQGFETYADCTSYGNLNDATARSKGTVEGRAIWDQMHKDVTSDRVYERIGEWLQTARPPFFLFVHWWDAHFDYIPPPPYDTLFDPTYAGAMTGENFFFNEAVHKDMERRDLEHLIALYDGEIAWVDMHIGKLLDDLAARQWLDHTLVVVLADHGSAFFEHGLKAHRNALYDEVIRIPLIMRLPGRVAAGARYTRQARIIDVAPTVLDVAGVAADPATLMGQPLTPLFSGAAPLRDEPAVSELLSMSQQLRSVRRLDRKLIIDERSKGALVYDLRRDPGERAPLQTQLAPPAPDAIKDLAWAREWLAAFRTSLAAVAESVAVPDDLLNQLRAHGYVGSATSQPSPPPDRP